MSSTSYAGLLISDVDSTLITQEVIELIAAHAGVEEKVAQITQRAMLGEIDFTASLAERVKLLAGLDAKVLAEVKSALELRQGAKEMISAALAANWRIVLVSGGFKEIITDLATELGVHQVVANSLELKEQTLSGNVCGEIVTAKVKARTLSENQHKYGISKNKIIALGDGANDLDFMRLAGTKIGINPKPKLAKEVDVVLKDSLFEVAKIIQEMEAKN